jgi:hypothetical protein
VIVVLPAAQLASTRAQALDLAATWPYLRLSEAMPGPVSRFPFDDEIASLSMIEPWAARHFLSVFLQPTTFIRRS